MSMTIVLKTQLFRGDWDQARSQYSLLWFMEALCRVDQSHIRQFRHLFRDKKITKPYPRIYKSGIHYERERGTEEWLDIPTVLAGGSYPGEIPGPWGDCLPISTLVMRDDFTFLPIGSLQPGDRIMGDGEWTTVVEQAVTGEKPILAFDLDNGSVLRCSPNHRLFKSDGTEVRAEDVKPGERLLTPTSAFDCVTPQAHGSLSSEDFAWILGVYVADGWNDYPRHPRFCISGLDGKPKEEQKKRVQAIMENVGIATRWHEKYIAVNDKELAGVMASCGGRAAQKHLPSLAMSKEQVKAVLEGLKADASFATSGTVTHGTVSEQLALQLRVLYRMLGQSVHIRRWDDHGGLGEQPIYRITVRRSEEELERKSAVKKSARVRGIREEAEELCADITTDTGRFWLPESDMVVHNCEDLACWRVAELRERPARFGGPIKAKPFAKFRLRDDNSYAYHALVLLPNGRLEDPSLTMGMGWEQDFYKQDIARKYQRGELPVQVRFAEAPDVIVIDPESPTGFSSNTGKAKKLTGLDKDPVVLSDGAKCTNASAAEIGAWGYNESEVNPKDMAELKEAAVGFRSGRLGRLGQVGKPETNWSARFLHINNSISYPSF